MVNVCFQVSTFFIEAVDLGDVQKMIVEKAAGSQWHLGQITVKKGAFAPTEDVFRYDRFVTLHSSKIIQIIGLHVSYNTHTHRTLMS